MAITDYLIPSGIDLAAGGIGAILANNQTDPMSRLRSIIANNVAKLRARASQDSATGLIATATSATATKQARAAQTAFAKTGGNPALTNTILQGEIAPSEAELADTKNRILQYSTDRADRLNDEASQLELQGELSNAEFQNQKRQAVINNVVGGVTGAGKLVGAGVMNNWQVPQIGGYRQQPQTVPNGFQQPEGTPGSAQPFGDSYNYPEQTQYPTLQTPKQLKVTNSAQLLNSDSATETQGTTDNIPIDHPDVLPYVQQHAADNPDAMYNTDPLFRSWLHNQYGVEEEKP